MAFPGCCGFNNGSASEVPAEFMGLDGCDVFHKWPVNINPNCSGPAEFPGGWGRRAHLSTGVANHLENEDRCATGDKVA